MTASVLDHVMPLTSRHGLLLARLDREATRGYSSPIILDLAVCNLLTGAYHILTTLKLGSAFDESKWSGNAILTHAELSLQ